MNANKCDLSGCRSLRPRLSALIRGCHRRTRAAKAFMHALTPAPAGRRFDRARQSPYLFLKPSPVARPGRGFPPTIISRTSFRRTAMGLKVAINGFGRIGRLVTRAALQHPEIDF